MPILIVEPKILNSAKKKELKDAGYIVIETDKPDAIKLFDEIGKVDQNILLVCALESLGYGNDGTCRTAFGDLVRKKLLNKK